MISIVMPVYNTAKYIRRSLDGIIAQTDNDWELVAVDDCSTDGSYEILQQYADRDTRIKVYRNEENVGCGLTRRRAIELAKGEWFAFIDSDDYVDKCFLQEMSSACRIWDADIAVCGTYNHNANGVYINQDLAEKYYTFTGAESYEEYMQTSYVKQYNANKLFSRRVIETIEYSPRRFCEDSSTTYLWLWNARKIVVIPRSYYHYVQHEGSNSRKTLSNMLEKTVDTVKCLDEHRQFSIAHGFDKIEKEKITPALRGELVKAITLADTSTPLYMELNKIREEILTPTAKQ